MEKTSVPLEQKYYFNAAIDEPLILVLQTLRDESAYDADPNSEITALEFIEKISKCTSEKLYLIVAGDDVAPPSKLRTKKGALWGEGELRKLDNRNFEVLIDGNNTRLVSVVDLKDFSYTSPSKVLYWISCMLVLSTLDLDELVSVVSEWISRDRKSILPYNYNAVAKALLNLESTAVLRYFPADNGKPESLVAVGQKDYLDKGIIPCIQNLI